MNRPLTQEDHISQIPALQLLQNMGFQYLTPDEALDARGGRHSNVLLEDILKQQLFHINNISHKGKSYKFTDTNLDAAIRELKRYPMQEGYMSASKWIYDKLTLGQSFEQIIEGDKKDRSLRYIDWEQPENNVFHVTEEFSVTRSQSNTNYRPDIVAFVNGIPLIIIECKTSTLKEPIHDAIVQHNRNQQEDGIRSLYVFSQLLMSICTDDARYGTTNTSEEFWSFWKEQYTEEQVQQKATQALEKLVNTPLSPVIKDKLFSTRFKYVRHYFEQLAQSGRKTTAQDVALYHLCQPARLLELIYHFTLYDGGIKKIARYQQYFSVKNSLKRIKNYNPDGSRRGGVVWHTQGSGKSLTMVMLAQKILKDKDIKNPQIVLVTDRIDLDQQISETFDKCDVEVAKANTGVSRLMRKKLSGQSLSEDELKKLRTDQSLLGMLHEREDIVITTVINKFEAAIEASKAPFDSPNIFILVDEGHRSQFGVFHASMRRVFRKGCFIGFTGTPLMKKDKMTADKFGGLIDKYTILSAVEDGAVVPLLFEGRHVMQEVNNKPIDNYFKRIAEPLNEYQRAELKRKYKRADPVNKADQKVAAIAWDISYHFDSTWANTGRKAQLVAPNKATAVKYKKYLDEIGIVTSEVVMSAPDMREGSDALYDEPVLAIKQFYQKQLDARGKDFEKHIISDFKKKDHPQIIIVIDKLLTGFDCPRNTVLYITRSLKEHTLLQAIARVNRVYPGKDYGYIIDYFGILEELDKALATYSGTEDFDAEDLIGTITNAKEEIAKLPQRHAELRNLFQHIPNKLDDVAYKETLRDEAVRVQFYDRLSIFARTLKLALSNLEFLDNTPDAQVKNYKKDASYFLKLRVKVRQLYSDDFDYKQYEAQIQRLIDQHITSDPDDIIKITELVNILDKQAFDKELEKVGGLGNKADTAASRTAKFINENMEKDPVFFKKLSQILKETIEAYQQKRITELEFFNRAMALKEQALTGTSEDIPAILRDRPEAQAFYGVLDEVLSHKDTSADKQARKELTAKAGIGIDEVIKNIIISDGKALVDWHNSRETERRLRQALDDYIYDFQETQALNLSFEEIDEIISLTVKIAKKNYA